MLGELLWFLSGSTNNGERGKRLMNKPLTR
ncbi:hypothetical protein [Paenibacillus chitinolyticus]